MNHAEPPDESFIVDAGRRINLAPDAEGKRLLAAACEAYKEACRACRSGYMVNLKTEKFRAAERRLQKYLIGRL